MSNKQKFYQLLGENKEVIISNLELANNFFSRFKGLMLRKEINAADGLLISPCKQVHTHFMRFPIDVIFIDKELKVIHIINSMSPWRLSEHYREAHYVLETRANSAAAILKLNTKLELIIKQTIT